MRVTNDKMEISSSESIAWRDVKRLRLLNEKFALVLKSGEVVEFKGLRPSLIDSAFKAYEAYIRAHRNPKQRKQRSS